MTHIPQVINTLTYLRWMNALHQLDIKFKCQDDHEVAAPCGRQSERLIPTKRCCQSFMVDPPYTKYNSCDVCLNYLQTNPVSWLPCDMKSVLDLPSWPYLLESFPTHQGMCAELMPYYNPGEFLTVCCENHSYYQNPFHGSYIPHGPGRRSDDPFVINSIRDKHKRLCDQLAYQRKHGWQAPPLYFLSTAYTNVTGEACINNRTLTFLIMDTRGSHRFAQQLGINITSTHEEPVLVIFDKRVRMDIICSLLFINDCVLNKSAIIIILYYL